MMYANSKTLGNLIIIWLDYWLFLHSYNKPYEQTQATYFSIQ